MADVPDLNALMETGARAVGDIVWSVLSSYNSLLLKKNPNYRDDLKAAAEEFDQLFKTGKVTIRKQPERTTTPRARASKKEKEKDGEDGKTTKTKAKYDDIINRVRAKKNKLTWRLLSEDLDPGDIPKPLQGGYYCTDKVLGLDEKESIVAFYTRKKYAVECIINDQVEARHLTTNEAERFRLFDDVIVDNSNVNDKDQEFFIPTF